MIFNSGVTTATKKHDLKQNSLAGAVARRDFLRKAAAGLTVASVAGSEHQSHGWVQGLCGGAVW